MEDLTEMCWHGLEGSLPLAVWLMDQVPQLHILELTPALVPCSPPCWLCGMGGTKSICQFPYDSRLHHCNITSLHYHSLLTKLKAPPGRDQPILPCFGSALVPGDSSVCVPCTQGAVHAVGSSVPSPW